MIVNPMKEHFNMTTLVLTLVPIKRAGTTYAPPVFVDMSDAHATAFVTAGSGVKVDGMDTIAATKLLNPKAPAVNAPASAVFEAAFGSATVTVAPTAAALTASVTKAPAAVADATGVITVNGGPAKSVGTVVLTFAVASGADVVATANVTVGMTANQAAAAVLAAIAAKPADYTSANTGATVTITPAAGKALTKFTVAVTGTN